MKTRIILFGFLSVIAFWVSAQKDYRLQFEGNSPLKVRKLEKRKFKDSLAVLDYLEKMWLTDISKGFPLASCDSLVWERNKLRVKYYRGPSYNKIRVLIAEKDEDFIRSIPSLSEKALGNMSYDGQRLKEVLESVLSYCENNGYPFAKVGLNRAKSVADEVHVDLQINTGPYVEIKSIEVKGEAAVAKKYVCNYINIQEGDAYSEDALKDISSRMQQVAFLSEIRAHEVLFTPEGCVLYLYLKSNPVSLINGVAGLQQDPISDKTIVTGDIRLKLQNTLKRGELLEMNWRSLQPGTQELNAAFNYPFLFNTPFGIKSSFALYKQDSSFLTTNVNLGIQYFLKGGNYINAFYERENSAVLRSSSMLGNLSNVSTNRYGLGFYRRRLDYIPNPSKGLIVESTASLGRRNSRENDTSIVEVATTFKVDFSVDAFFPITPRNVLRFNGRIQSYYAPEIYTNEVFRFGGLNSQRGFNEQSLWATTYALIRAEYRFLVDKNSHLFAFFDQSLYESTVSGYAQDEPYGFGAGFSFGSNLGIFSISYALGKQMGNPIQLSDGKVHFGYIAYF